MTSIPYLQPDEYASFGIGDASDGQVSNASRIVDGYLGRPEGMIWCPDANGDPAYMAGLTPTFSGSVPLTIAPGSDVQVTLASGLFGPQAVGQVVILDRSDADAVEACAVTAASGTTLTLQSVRFAHPAGATLEFGLTLLKESPLDPRRSSVRIARKPIAAILSVFGRNSPPGVPGRPQTTATWTPLDPLACDLNMVTGEVWIPSNSSLSSFSDIRLSYVTGWDQANIPTDLKQATANIVRGMIDMDGLSGNIKLLKAGDATIERFSASSLSDDTRSYLQPFRIVTLG